MFAVSSLYLIEILHQTTTGSSSGCCRCSCILSKFYIKPQRHNGHAYAGRVVSYRNSTSNHNTQTSGVKEPAVVSYRNSTSNHNPPGGGNPGRAVVSYRNSTSNHNKTQGQPGGPRVVSYRNSTSNHNQKACLPSSSSLYLIEILHQTTTTGRGRAPAPALYLIEILHQTTTMRKADVSFEELYLIEILHQTTTYFSIEPRSHRCILSKFYIKPQLPGRAVFDPLGCILSKFYIKPQRNFGKHHIDFSCILSKFYIKPQLLVFPEFAPPVVSYRNSTSNHNDADRYIFPRSVVSYRNSTSNHNNRAVHISVAQLYLIEILHQTTTSGLILIDKVLLTGCLPL